VGVEDPNNELAGKTLQLNFEGDGTVIEVYWDPEMTQRIYSGSTWDIGEITEVYVKGVGEGSSELVLTLEEPIVGERPLSDIVVVRVNA
jgi:hypothetical protein